MEEKIEDVRGKKESLLSSHLASENDMLTQFGTKVHLALQKGRGEGDKWGEEDDRGEGKQEKGIITSKHLWGGTRSKERIE